VSSKLQFTASYSVKQITVYSNLLFQQINVYINLPCQANFRLQQCTVSSKLQFTAIYRVNQITITAIYRIKQITVYSGLGIQRVKDNLKKIAVNCNMLDTLNCCKL
jgi:hypothetical protein